MLCRLIPRITVFLVLLQISVPAASPAVRTLEIGAPAPDFNLPGVDGKIHRLKDYAGAKVLCIIFTCNHCPTAQAYEERIKKIVKDYKSRGVAVVAISPNDPLAVRLNELGYTDLSDSFEEMKIRARHKKFNFPYLYDGKTQAVARAYGPVATPHAFAFDAQRKLRYVGRIDNSERVSAVKTHDLRNALDSLLQGRPVSVAKTRVFGCSIKWASKREAVKRSLKPPKPESIKLQAIGVKDLKKLVSSKEDKWRLINVWATWCGPCVAEFPDLVKMQRMYGHRAFELVTVSADFPDNKDRVLAFLRKQGADTRNCIFDSEDRGKLIETVDADWQGGIPYTMLVSPKGTVVYRHMGRIDVLEVRRKIVKALGARGSR